MDDSSDGCLHTYMIDRSASDHKSDTSRGGVVAKDMGHSLPARPPASKRGGAELRTSCATIRSEGQHGHEMVERSGSES